MARRSKKCWKIYTLIHGVFLVSIFMLAYSFPEKLSSNLLLELILFVFISLWSLGLLLLSNRWGIWLEAMRMLILLSLIFLVGFRNAPGFLFGYFSLLLVAISAAVILNSMLYRILSAVYEH